MLYVKIAFFIFGNLYFCYELIKCMKKRDTVMDEAIEHFYTPDDRTLPKIPKDDSLIRRVIKLCIFYGLFLVLFTIIASI